MATNNFFEYSEVIDIVDENDNVVRSILRADAIEEKIAYRRLVFVFLKNRDGKLCFLRRADHLSYYPGNYALVSGGVQASETYEQALLRETEEEINFIPQRYKLLEILSPKEIQEQHFKAIYEVKPKKR
jgi:8-oxo-dGTP pyrophosphatase MutT (NUDIX family)